ncbi:MAG: hypothetical protein K0Q84_1639 [Arthrobacter sp.]|nr:hypothetical protein [Arthrobacter sp.]
MMKRQGNSGLQRAYLLWSVAGVSLIAAAATGSSVIRLVSGTADAGSTVWGIIGIAALLDAFVLFVLGWRLRQRYVNTVQTYESRGAYLADDGSKPRRLPGGPRLESAERSLAGRRAGAAQHHESRAGRMT